jgi:hypothetical protein
LTRHLPSSRRSLLLFSSLLSFTRTSTLQRNSLHTQLGPDNLPCPGSTGHALNLSAHFFLCDAW